jgi:UDP-N-acetylmuramoyl-tripeptide--D-alanyl-D-alanine ligase
MSRFISIYLPDFPKIIAYMLQSTEYDWKAYLSWLNRTKDFRNVAHRRNLDLTPVARSFVTFLYIGIVFQLLVAAGLIVTSVVNADAYASLAALTAVVTAPIVWAYLVVIPMVVAKRFIITPKLKKQRNITRRILKKHQATIIAVAGSYGKTTMKELLTTVLSEGKRVTSTPGNKNVATAHYQFAKSLNGDEEVLVVEFGEGRPGDVAMFTETVQPDIAVITGLAPAHLDQYGSIEKAGLDIFSLASHVKPADAYVNAQSHATKDFIKPDYIGFDGRGIDGWTASDPHVDLDGTRFVLQKGKKHIHIHSGLIGAHLVGVLSATAVIADRLGLTTAQIEAGFKKTRPYEHRMQPYRIGSAWIIDDSYNGNIQGVEAGTELLSSLKAKRRVYVTPGLVEQGAESDIIHVRMGELIAAAQPDMVVLMKNSATEHIQAGLVAGGYEGALSIQADALKFYTNLDQFVAAGDVVMLQNDWTDNYQ